jgi:hypothetical protein
VPRSRGRQIDVLLEVVVAAVCCPTLVSPSKGYRTAFVKNLQALVVENRSARAPLSPCLKETGDEILPVVDLLAIGL